jgi:hypothetical protein
MGKILDPKAMDMAKERVYYTVQARLIQRLKERLVVPSAVAVEVAAVAAAPRLHLHLQLQLVVVALQTFVQIAATRRMVHGFVLIAAQNLLLDTVLLYKRVWAAVCSCLTFPCFCLCLCFCSGLVA